ncbi:pentatricopeptide repeat domain-containing protein 3 mitochondrial [Biomphalaria glabrata]|uniref:Small ribosomal subunit protein mS39 n=1 Tax=Biomphalaria glabrata TaxID=6526 RepID=A0A9W2ZGS5_BIOGL|nr:protein PTCD3 homolog, mitochondrial-like [Biomphalaria glabrata]KAI8768206.1 pentatricopeptide repeat domain-containing protein 3; mitochondrial-like [Biomphalaria glabrata]KAI8777357.1 pentatricopeptide repeat domain-containing protein 3, mitochondrial [Biomphalaria glabrata]
MAAAIRKHSKVILSRAKFIEQNLRHFTVGQSLLGNTWFIYDKAKKKKDFIPVEHPIKIDKTPEAELQPIVIPDKIERSPTAILEALASTVRNDINQPMYSSIDDPYLYCNSDFLKKNNMAAKDSGRKTARMMMSMYPEYITQIWEEPLPEVWRDIVQGYVHKEPSEAALLERIAKRKVSDAIQVYEAVNPKSQLSQETIEKFLELLCVFNNQSPEIPSDVQQFIEPPSFIKDAPFPAVTWQKESLAEQVFRDLPVKTTAAYCYLIRGMATYFNKNGAMSLFREMRAANLTADVLTYNDLLSVASLDLETMEEVILEIETLLKDMAASNVKPNVQTFNSVLFSCNRVSRWSGCKKFALSVMSEMKALELEPTLATYLQMLKIFYDIKDKSPKTKNADLFLDILNNMESKEYQLTCENDLLFFRMAMRVITTHLPDAKIALRLHTIFKTGKNSDLVGHRQLQFTYYLDLISLIAQLEHTDVVMNLYQSVCPFIFYPTSDIYLMILENISLYNTFQYIPVIYTDIQRGNYFVDKNFALTFFKTLAQHKHEPTLQGQLCDIVQSLLAVWKLKQEKMHQLPAIDGDVIGEMIIIHLNNDDHVKACELFELYKHTRSLRKTSPSALSLSKLAKKLISVPDYNAAKNVMTTMLALDYEGIPDLVETCLDLLALPEEERMYLEGLARSAPSKTISESTSSSSESSSSDSDSD